MRRGLRRKPGRPRSDPAGPPEPDLGAATVDAVPKTVVDLPTRSSRRDVGRSITVWVVRSRSTTVFGARAGRYVLVSHDHGGPGDALESVQLTTLAAVRGGVPVALVCSG